MNSSSRQNGNDELHEPLLPLSRKGGPPTPPPQPGTPGTPSRSIPTTTTTTTVAASTASEGGGGVGIGATMIRSNASGGTQPPSSPSLLRPNLTTTNSAGGSGGPAGILSSPPPTTATSTQQQHRRRNSNSVKLLTKLPSRPRKAIAQFRKQRRDWSTWTGRIGVHLKVEEFQIDKLSATLQLNGWQWDDHFDVVRLWQVEPPYIGHELWNDLPPVNVDDVVATGEEPSPGFLPPFKQNSQQQQQQQQPLHPPPPPPPPVPTGEVFSTTTPVSSGNTGTAATVTVTATSTATISSSTSGTTTTTTMANNNTTNMDMMAVLPEVYVFSFGAVVFWNFPNAESESKWMIENLLTSTLQECYGETFIDEEIEAATDEMAFQFGATTTTTTTLETTPSSSPLPSQPLKFMLQRDVATLTTREFGERLAVSFAIAKSSLLSMYEYRVQQSIERNSHIPEELATHGRIQMSRREIVQEVGQLFLLKHGINLDNSLIDTPEELWTDDRFESIYEATLRYFEVTKRLELVNNRLSMIGELHQVLTEQNAHRHEVFLEWIIILLIVAEVVLDVMKIWF